MQEESKEKSKDAPFESLRILSERWKNGTFSEIIDDWKWIFGYSARYKGAIVFYTILSILSTFAWACRQRGRKIPDRYHHRIPDTEAPAAALHHDRKHRVQPWV